MIDRLKLFFLSLGPILGLALCLVALTWLALIAGTVAPAQAAGIIRYVSPGGTNSNNLCANSAQPCQTIQHAVDMAAPGDEIRVAAGTYTGVTVREGYTQVVYITKPLTLRGGFTPANWSTPNPTNNPTTLNAQGQGGVVGISSTVGVTIEGLRLTSEKAGNRTCGICVVSATVTLHDNNLYSNTTGILIGFGSIANVSHNAIYSNTLDGVEFFFLSGQAILADNTISGNKWSGVTLFGSSGVTLERNLIENNLTIENCDPLSETNCHGGGVFLYVSNATLNENIIRYNQAGLDGGGVSLTGQSTATLRGNTIIDNMAGRIGGGVSLKNQSAVYLEHNTISNNTASQGGGGVAVLDSNDRITLEGNLIAGNTAEGPGGGLVLGSSQYPTSLNGDIIRDNEASTLGGGLYFSGGQLTMTNTVIADNQTGVAGSGIHLFNPQARLFHTTIARNNGGDGSGLTIGPSGSSSVTLTNTILVSQTLGLTASAGSTAILDGVLWFGNGSNTGGAGTINVTNPHTGDPAFAADGYHLTPTSAALDQGVDAGVRVDIDDQPRPFGVTPDLGADEGQPALLVTKEASPPFAQPGHPLIYILRVTNTGFVDLHATITDTLPDQVTPTGVPTWTATIPAFGGVWTEQIVVTVAPDFTGTLTNVVEVGSVEGARGEYTRSVGRGWVYYLPVVWRDK